MKNSDDSASSPTLAPLATMGDAGHRPLLPALTILAHPDPTRVGETAPLSALIDGRPAQVNRHGPLFFPFAGTIGRPLDHQGVSKSTSFLVLPKVSGAARFELQRGDATKPLELGLAPFEGTRPLLDDDLDAGLLLTINKRVVLCLHRVRHPIVRSDDLGLLGASDQMEEVRRKILRAAANPDSPVLVRGPTGAGKELVARAIHQRSKRSSGPYHAISVADISSSMADSELFGHIKGSFTDAKQGRNGAFLEAHGGTLFLDEIGEASKDLQTKLLRVLAEKVVRPVGSDRARTVDVRIVAATDKDLEADVLGGRFDDALFHRLNVYSIDLPPLRLRRQDIGLLLFSELAKLLRARGAADRLVDDPQLGPWIPARTIVRLALAPWPGNVRELLNVATRLVMDNPSRGDVDPFVQELLDRSARLSASVLPPATSSQIAVTSNSSESAMVRAKPTRVTLAQLLDALARNGSNKAQAARELGMSRPTFYKRLVEELPYDEIARQHAECGGDLEVLAKKLGVPVDVLDLLLRRRPT